jgi:polar amino acid transport system substrate-binding protein
MTRRDLLAALPAFAAAGPASGTATGASALKVGAALPDPPFEFIGRAGPSGFDIALMQHIAAKLGRAWQLVRYDGADFNGIFAGLDSGAYDCVASGTTITPAREKVAISARLMRCPGNRWWSIRRGIRRCTASTILPGW